MADTGRAASGGRAPVSFATIALWVAGAGVAGMALTAAAVGLLPLPPAGRAIAALVGIVVTIVAMGLASNHVTNRAIRAEYGDEYGSEGETGDTTAPTGHGSDVGHVEGDDRRGTSDGLG